MFVVIGCLVLAVLLFGVWPLALMLAWNAFAVPVLHAPTISFFGALGLVILLAAIRSVFARGGKG